MKSSDDTLAREVWRKFFDYFVATRWRRDEVLERLGVTPNDAKALHSLDRHEGKPMGELAEEWGTDPSGVTWVVDRLEERGLAERRSDTDDRRVKRVVLTKRGAEVRAEIMRAFYQPPPELLELKTDDLRALRELLVQIVAGTPKSTDKP